MRKRIFFLILGLLIVASRIISAFAGHRDSELTGYELVIMHWHRIKDIEKKEVGIFPDGAEGKERELQSERALLDLFEDQARITPHAHMRYFLGWGAVFSAVILVASGLLIAFQKSLGLVLFFPSSVFLVFSDFAQKWHYLPDPTQGLSLFGRVYAVLAARMLEQPSLLLNLLLLVAVLCCDKGSLTRLKRKV